MRIRRTVSRRLTQAAVAGAVAAAAGLAGALATGPAASASPAAGQAAPTTPTWRTQAPREPAGTIDPSFDGVSCSSSSACLAIASNYFPHNNNLGDFAETWNGSHWAVRTVPNGTGKVYLEAVKCRSARWCVAAGGIQAASPADGNQVPVADRWRCREKLPTGDTPSRVAGISCTAGPVCEAVGFHANPAVGGRLLALRYSSR
ncbi:MAG: hypothetical protein ACRDRJ_25060 [Streptosporangiaceae bacterium]